MPINGTLLHTPGVVGVWNVSQYPCVDFRSKVVQNFFCLWPEMLDGVFNYCCEDGASNYSLANFTYGLHQGRLDPRPYFDLGVVDTFLPYWYFWTFWRVPTKSISFPLHCDYTDLHSLYVRRFWKKIIVLGAKTAAVLVGGLELAVLLLVLFLWAGPFCFPGDWTSEPNRAMQRRWRRKMFKGWFKKIPPLDLWSDWAHLILLALIGGCMMEAIGHSSLHTWRASVMYNAGAVYSYLTAMAILSSLVRQIAMCFLPPKMGEALPYEDNNAPRNNNAPQLTTPPQVTGTRPGQAWRRLKGVSDDWRWQKVFAQLGVLILMGTYLVLVDTDDGGAMDNVAGIVLAAVVAACIWSACVTIVVFFHSVLFMIFASWYVQHVLNKYLDSNAQQAQQPVQQPADFHY